MRFISTRKGIGATSAETVFQGLAPDGGLYVPVLTQQEGRGPFEGATLREAEEYDASRTDDGI